MDKQVAAGQLQSQSVQALLTLGPKVSRQSSVTIDPPTTHSPVKKRRFIRSEKMTKFPQISPRETKKKTMSEATVESSFDMTETEERIQPIALEELGVKQMGGGAVDIRGNVFQTY